jgi:hypothetical protein
MIKACLKSLWFSLLWLLMLPTLQAQDTIRFTGTTLSNVDYHHGQLRPAVGVHNIQVMRASREHPAESDGFGWTYNHAPMLAYWNNTFYLQYLANPVGEHVPPGQTLLATSKDGYNWSKPALVFAPYKVPDGFKKPDYPGVANNLFAVMHQRMGFYVASNGRLLTLAYYGIAMDAKDDPNDGNGIGRVVREIYKDGTLGPVHFIRYNHLFNERNTSHPFYESSSDREFVKACDELLSKPLMLQQWNEEADRNDALISLQKEYKAFNYYTLPDGKVVGLWKHALTSVTANGGKTWKYNPMRAPGFVNSNAKIWGQRTSDGKYATVYNPSEFRWPLALSVSKDGLKYHNLLLVNGEISPMRYGGNYKSFGPQYVRGILEGNGKPADGNMWVTYSMNKEDIWVATVPVPVIDSVSANIDEDFKSLPAQSALKFWNIFSPVHSRVSIGKSTDGTNALVLRDSDAFDYAKAERIIPASRKAVIEFELSAAQNNYGTLQVEVQDGKGTVGLRLQFDADSLLKAKTGARYKRLGAYKPDEKLNVKIDLDCTQRMYRVYVNGKPENGSVTLFYAPLANVERVVFRTGERRFYPTVDTPADNTTDLAETGKMDKEAVYFLYHFKATRIE